MAECIFCSKRQFSNNPTTETIVLNFSIHFGFFQGSLYGLTNLFLLYVLLIRFGEKKMLTTTYSIPVTSLTLLINCVFRVLSIKQFWLGSNTRHLMWIVDRGCVSPLSDTEVFRQIRFQVFNVLHLFLQSIFKQILYNTTNKNTERTTTTKNSQSKAKVSHVKLTSVDNYTIL